MFGKATFILDGSTPFPKFQRGLKIESRLAVAVVICSRSSCAVTFFFVPRQSMIPPTALTARSFTSLRESNCVIPNFFEYETVSSLIAFSTKACASSTADSLAPLKTLLSLTTVFPLLYFAMLIPEPFKICLNSL